MRATSIILTAIMIAVLTIIIALVVADNSQYTNPIHVASNGIAHITTDRGDQVYSDIEYISGNAVYVKPSAINTVSITPSALPSTSTPNGTYTCDYTSHGVVYSVTNNTPCTDR